MLLSIVLSFGIVGGVLADPISLFNVDPGAPISAYEAGITNGVTTYLLGCNASASATGACDFTAPVTLIEGPNTFHVAITKPLGDGVVQSLTVDCSAGTTGACSVTALNTASQTTTISFPPASFSAGITAIPAVASPQALLYNGVPLPTASSSISASSSFNSTVNSTSSSNSPTVSATGVYGNSTTGTTAKATVTAAGPSSTSSGTATTKKSGAGSQYMRAQGAVYAGLVAAVFLAGNL